MKQSILTLAAAAVFLASAAHGAEQNCKLEKYADLPVTMSGTRPLISGTINGQPAKFLADSGAFFSLLSRDAAAKYDLRVGSMPPNVRVRGTGGAAEVGLTKVKEFTLAGFVGGRVLNDVSFMVGGGGGLYNDTAGIIGQNVLGNGDAEYDLANGAIRVFRAKNCRGAMLAYWARTNSIAELDIEETTPRSPHLIGQAKINGKRIRVVFDTGAWRSILTLDAAARAGIEPEDDGVIAAGISRGLGKKTTENSIARFDTLDLGGEVIKNARLRIGELRLADTDMLLGADFFLSHRVYVASEQNKIYFTYNGGPVFDLRENPNDAKNPGTEPPAATLASTPEAAAEIAPSLESDALRRRGAASAGRRDFDAAIADLDRAIELDANDPENFYERGLARWQSGQPVRAFADFDAALKLKPDHVQSLLARGTLRLRGGNETGAGADFQEALELSEKDPGVGLRVAEAYQRAGKFAASIERLNVWIAANPKDDRIPAAMVERCRSRAMTGKELELARADCDIALKKGPKNSAVYDTRGLVLLLLGNVDDAIADYKSALKLQPKHASALYGLGLAEIKKGLNDSGNSNIAAAVEINPSIAAAYKRAGLTPQG